MRSIRIGAGAGYSGDRIDPAVELAERGDIQYLVFECLAERTIAIAQQAKLADPSVGYDPLLVERMAAVLKPCAEQKIKIVTNMGAANPPAAAATVRELAVRLGIDGLKIAALTGDDVLEPLKEGGYTLLETGEPIAALGNRVVSANAYLGAGPIVTALAEGADVVITGRVADPALFLAPLIHEFGWGMDNWSLLGKGTLVGHLLECAGQVTGGYYADPGVKDVEGLARLGFPLAEVREDGHAVITKVAGSGGRVTSGTCKEQLLYEIHDPAAYLTPDVTADFSQVAVTEIARNRVAIEGASGRARPETLKVSVGIADGYIGEGQISYAGPGALARGQLAREVIGERLQLTQVETSELRMDLIGVDAIFGAASPPLRGEPNEVRLRVAGRTQSLAEARRIGNEVETLYTNGPAGGGGAWKSAREVIAMYSALMPRGLVHPALRYLES